ncbi:glycosyl transferase [Prauserella oleivorans]|uniref:Glycosyl transferase n=1 Tax=Prauserella oleivorans TaxID=1478153 RepID=A0ABW5W7C9_9PSEU
MRPRALRRRPDWLTAGRTIDALVVLGFLLAAFLLYRPLWMDLGRAYLTSSVQDQNMWEWFFAVTARAVLTLDNPLFTDLQNHPLGVNLMANTAMLGIGVPLTPVTVLFGPTATWALTLTGGLAATSTAWYWLLSRHVVDTRAGAAIGAAFCGFAPPIISHANAHPNFVVLALLPLIVHRLLLLTRGARPVRNGVILGLLVAYQVFLGEEPLLIAATTMAVFAAVYALSRPAEALAMARPLGTGIAVGACVTVLLVAFPLWWQFAGPQSYTGIEHGLQGNDVTAFTSFATESLAGDHDSAQQLSLNRTEENAFFGWPLVVLLAAVSIALWRVVAARALAVAMVVLAWISTGVLLIVDGTATSVPGPWMLLFDLPLYESVLESRFALGCVAPAGILLALATERVLRPRWPGDWRHVARTVWFSALALALVPIAPTELRVSARDPAPVFFTDDTWRRYVEPGGSVVVVPLPDSGDAEALHWQVEAGLGFPLAEGYFVGPSPDGRGTYGAVRRPTSSVLEDVAESGVVPTVTAREREQALADLRYWRADVVVLPTTADEEDALRTTVERLLDRDARFVDGVWVWDVRSVTSA